MTISSRLHTTTAIGLATLAGLLLTALPAAAQVQTEKLQVQATIGDQCTVTSASLDFGSNVTVNNETSTEGEGSIAIDCISESNFSVQLDGGLRGSPGSAQRIMANGGDLVTYFLFKDASRNDPWSAGTTVPGPTGGTGTVPVYGFIAPQSDSHPPGLYTDEVTITLVF